MAHDSTAAASRNSPFPLRVTIPAMSDADLSSRIDALVADLTGRGSVLVAYSGGVDSAVVAALAYRALGERALAMTAAAETLAGAELDVARKVAAEIGIRHETVTYSEL